MCLGCNRKKNTVSTLIECAKCGNLKTADEFGRTQESLAVACGSKHRERLVCLQCLYPPCANTECPRCPSCLEETCAIKGKCTKTPNQQQERRLKGWRRNEAKAGDFRCPGCELRVCKFCKQEKCSREFASDRRTERCKACLHPACTNPLCSTCKTCRDPSCKNPRCEKEPKALPGTVLASIADLSTYECDACFFPACANVKCPKTMSAKTRGIKKKSVYWRAMRPRTWLCEDCTIRAAHRGKCRK